MGHSPGRRIGLGLLLLLAAGIFAAGIDWGLPSSSLDAWLCPPSSISADSTQLFTLSGAGIEHLAGSWQEDADRGSDVAQHPISSRSEPVVLIENRRGLSEQQILDSGDAPLADLVKQQEAAQNLADKYGADPNARASKLHDAEIALTQAGDAVRQYVDRHNADHFPGLTESIKQDQINRARILRRYRLYSNQPDEMITFRALAQMHPGAGDFDPRLYQYGGLWIYPVGGLLKGLSFIGVVTVSNDTTYYLDHPEAFARFYIVARAYSAAWGLVGVLAIFSLARRFTKSDVLAVAAAICFITMPVVIDLAHEAKPHLPGAVLLLLAILAGCKYVDAGKARWWIFASVLAGAAGGMILSDCVALLVIPAMVIARAIKRAGRARSASPAFSSRLWFISRAILMWRFICLGIEKS